MKKVYLKANMKLLGEFVGINPLSNSIVVFTNDGEYKGYHYHQVIVSDDAESVKAKLEPIKIGDETEFSKTLRHQEDKLLHSPAINKAWGRFKAAVKVEQPDSAAPSDSIIFEFAGWLTTRDAQLTISATDDAAPMAEAVKEFIELRNLRPSADFKPQRITEQEFYEIVTSTALFLNVTENYKQHFWIAYYDQVGRTLLAKLNENREPDYKAMAGELLHVIKRIVISWENKSDIFGAMLLARQTIAKHEGGK